MHEKRPPPNGEVLVPVHPSRRKAPAQAGAATVAAAVVEQVTHRLRLASIAAERDLVPRYAETLYVKEQALRDLLGDAAEITEIDLRRRLPGDLLFLLSRLLKEIDKP